MKRTETGIRSPSNGRKVDEDSALSDAIDSATQYLGAVVGSGDGFDPEEVEGIAQNIADLCAMWTVRKREREKADALAEARS